ncbi:SagB family peptide dehydrogenase [Halobacillus sp. H74]|uniref:SagB family peptide dehydrogenase n=1 Tax=Halobacillus sp. H74 TaxID=3457436 RepID=UPI003FCE002C
MSKEYSNIYKEYLSKCHSPLSEAKFHAQRNWSKIYYNTPKVPLKHNINIEDNTINVSALLKLSYGQTHLDVVNRKMQDKNYTQKFRRALPSGGGLYPNELYIWIKNDSQSGIYHYNPIGHELSLVKQGDFQSEINSIIGQEGSRHNSPLVFFVTSILDKNTYKYKYLSYRIQCLDTGVILQRLKETFNGFNFTTDIVLDFDDLKSKELINIDHNEGMLGIVTAKSNTKEIRLPKSSFNSRISKQIKEENHLDNNLKYKESDALDFIESLHHNSKFKSITNKIRNLGFDRSETSGYCIELPKRVTENEKDMLEYIDNRKTIFHHFMGTMITKNQLSLILSKVFQTKTFNTNEFPLNLYLYLRDIEGVSNGFYRYIPSEHKMSYINNEDIPEKIRDNVIQPDLDLYKVNVTAFITGNHNKAYASIGNRGYRILNIAAGLLLGKLLSNTNSIGLGTYPFLAYDVNLMKETLDLQNDEYPLIIAFLGVKNQNSRLTFQMY